MILLIVVSSKVWEMLNKYLLSEQRRYSEEPRDKFRGDSVGERHGKNLDQCCLRELPVMMEMTRI